MKTVESVEAVVELANGNQSPIYIGACSQTGTSHEERGMGNEDRFELCLCPTAYHPWASAHIADGNGGHPMGDKAAEEAMREAAAAC